MNIIKAFFILGIVVLIFIYKSTPFFGTFGYTKKEVTNKVSYVYADDDFEKPVILFIASPVYAQHKQPVKVTWSTANANSCIGGSNNTIPSAWDNPGTKGSFAFIPNGNTTLTIICDGPGGITIEKIDIHVGVESQPLSPSPSTLPNTSLNQQPILPLSVSCITQQQSSIYPYQAVTRVAIPNGGNGLYSYIWSGSDGLSGNQQWSSVAYLSHGVKKSTVTVFSGGKIAIAYCPDIEVTPNEIGQSKRRSGTTKSSSSNEHDETTNAPTETDTTEIETSELETDGPSEPPSTQPPFNKKIPTLTLTVSDDSIFEGESVTVTWDSSNVSFCSKPVNDGEKSPFPRSPGTSGSLIFNPTEDITLTLTCYQPGKALVTKSVSITVEQSNLETL